MTEGRRLLEVIDLRVYFESDEGVARAVDGVSFYLDEGETLAVVGESGSGKSITSLAIMRLVASPPGRIAGGRILYRGRDLLTLPGEEMHTIRGNEIAMVFQEPMTSLNPVFPIGDQIAEAIVAHRGASRRAAWAKAVEALALVGIPEPAARARSYPHELSGGMRQRVMIAMALCCDPGLLIADEPTTALDVTIQAQILDLMRRLQQEFGMAILFVTHDLGVVAEMADRVVVMYAGRAVEEASVAALFREPLMPYTRGLLGSVPRVDRTTRRRQPLVGIPGTVPSPLALPEGCAFHPRCGFATHRCREAVPPFEDSGGGHMVRCVRWRELQADREVL
jgi:oligopeptide/dipeptide ABC transporter ATP-binding protein